MQKTYRVHLIGHKEPIYIDGFKGKILADDFANGKLKGRNVEIEGGVYSGSDIRSVAPGNRPAEMNPSASNTNNVHQEISEEYFRERNRMLKLSPKDRAQNIGVAQVIYYVISGKALEDNDILRQKIVQVQEKFFAEHPRRIHPDPIIFKSAFDEFVPNARKTTIITDAGIRGLELAINRDISLAR